MSNITCDACGKEFWMDEVEESDYGVRKDCAKYDGWVFRGAFVFCPKCKNDMEAME